MKVIDGMVELPEAIQKLLEDARGKPIHYTRDAPKLTKKQLAQFKPRSAERLAKLGITPTRRTQDIQEPSKEIEESPKKRHRK